MLQTRILEIVALLHWHLFLLRMLGHRLETSVDGFEKSQARLKMTSMTSHLPLLGVPGTITGRYPGHPVD